MLCCDSRLHSALLRIHEDPEWTELRKRGEVLALVAIGTRVHCGTASADPAIVGTRGLPSDVDSIPSEGGASDPVTD